MRITAVPATLHCSLVWLLLASTAVLAEAPPKDRALTLYTGKMTDDDWPKSLTPSVELVDSKLAALAWSQVFLRATSQSWSLEWEANAVKHWGIQDHWEFNLAVGGRWHRFPWNDKVRTSAAFVVGPSYATEVPQVEIDRGGESQKWLAFWYLELALAPPDSDWSGLVRLHHRSDVFGALGDATSSNALTAGVRYAF
jgi:hypothetical protein